MTFANSLDPDQAQQNVGPDLAPNHLTPIVYYSVRGLTHCHAIKEGTIAIKYD